MGSRVDDGVGSAYEHRLERAAHARGARRRVDPDLKPVLTVTMLVAAFVALGVLLTVLSAIAALGGGGGVIVICGFPIALISFIVWLISQPPGGAEDAAADPDRVGPVDH